MTDISRRGFLVTMAAAGAVRMAPLAAVATSRGRPILTLVYDKGLGMMRAVERMVP